MSEIHELLISWLNKSRGTVSPSRDAVCKLLAALHGLEPLLREHPLATVPERGTSTLLHDSPGALLRDVINKQLASYEYKPTLRVVGAHSMSIGWLPPDSNDAKEVEAAMIRIVCDLYNEGNLQRVRECLCGQWFMGRSDNQECCKVECRQKKWGKTDQGKAAGKKASSAFYDRERRAPQLKQIKKAIRSWESKSAKFKASHDWKKWVAEAASVSKVFITKAANKGDILSPPHRE